MGGRGFWMGIYKHCRIYSSQTLSSPSSNVCTECAFVRVVSSRLMVQEQAELDIFGNISSILQGCYRSSANNDTVFWINILVDREHTKVGHSACSIQRGRQEAGSNVGDRQAVTKQQRQIKQVQEELGDQIMQRYLCDDGEQAKQGK